MTPNPDNYGTLPACQALVKAGIVMETEKCTDLACSDKIIPWPFGVKIGHEDFVPRPNMAEMWRELPLLIEEDKLFLPNLVKISDEVQGGILYSAHYSTPECSRPVPAVYHDANPTDALIHLRIWLKEKGEK